MGAVASVANHPGIAALATSPIAATTCTMFAGPTYVASMGLFNEVQEATFVFREHIAGIADLEMRLGLGNLWNSAPPSRGVWLEKLTTDGNWFLVVQNAASPTRVDTGLAAGTAAWINARFRRVGENDSRVSINGPSASRRGC